MKKIFLDLCMIIVAKNLIFFFLSNFTYHFPLINYDHAVENEVFYY